MSSETSEFPVRLADCQMGLNNLRAAACWPELCKAFACNRDRLLAPRHLLYDSNTRT